MSVRGSLVSFVVLSLGLTCSAQLSSLPNSSRLGANANTSPSDRTSTITGTIVSNDGAPIADARVTVRDLSGMVIASTYSDSRGAYVMMSVPTGSFELVAEKGITQASDRVMISGGDTQANLRIPIQTSAPDGSSTVSVASYRVPEKARKEFEKAQEAMNKNKFEDARKHDDKALQLYPEYAEALTMRGILEMNDGNAPQATDDFDHAIKADPSYALAYTTLGAVYNRNGQYKEAERLLSRAIALKPDSWQSYFEMAKTLLGQADYKKALEFVSKASAISQEYAPIHLVKAHALLGMKLYQDAVGELELFLNREPAGATADAARKTLSAAKAFATTAQK